MKVEQRNHASTCMYNISKSHLIFDCNIKKECGGILTSIADNSGHLQNTKEEIFEDTVVALIIIEFFHSMTTTRENLQKPIDFIVNSMNTLQEEKVLK
jgi:hypothetical protein